MSAENNSNRVCVVTGGSSGIGLATAKRFSLAGYVVAICGRDLGKLKDASREIGTGEESDGRCYFESTDFQMAGEAASFVRNIAKEFARIDVLVNCAGFAPLSDIASFPDTDFETAIKVNCRSVYETTKAVWPTFIAQQSGIIINVSSLAAVDPFPGFSVYGGCKAWVETFTAAMAAEGKQQGISAYSVRPGAVSTPMLHELFPDFPAEETLEPEEVADLICELAQNGSVNSGQAVEIKK